MELDIRKQEHISDTRPRKAVGLFARDSFGSGALELSALSTASGSVLSTTVGGSVQVALGNVTLNGGPNHIGSVTIFGTVQSTPGMTTLFGGPNFIGIVTVGNTPNANVSLGASAQYIGLVTAFPARSVTTNFAAVISASGYSTVFVPPGGQRFYIHSVLVNSKGVADGYIGSTSNPLLPWVGLATYGGFVHPNSGDPIPATAVDQSLTIRQHSLVTLSYQVSVHFE